MYQQVPDPVGGSLGLSALFAVLPLVTLFVLLAGLRLRAYLATLIALAVAVTVAIAVYGMPARQAFNSAGAGAAFGIFPILWIVVNALWIYTMTVATGHFQTLRRGVGAASGDERIQALIVGFSFGALLEALAGFGAPVAISAGMLLALGFEPLKAAGVALVGNTAPAAFGSLALPIITLSGVTGIDKRDLGAMVGRQLPFLALLVPLVIVYIVDGRRGLRETWPVALLAGSAFAVAQFVTSNYISVELTDVVASLASLGAIAGYLRLRRPEAVRQGIPRETIQALAPYLILIVILMLAQVDPVKGFLADRTKSFQWPGLEVTTAGGGEPPTATFTLNWLASPGTAAPGVGAPDDARPAHPASCRAQRLQGHARPLTRDDAHDHRRARARVRDEPFRRDRDDRAVGRGCRRHLRADLSADRLARRRDHRLGHGVELAVGRTPGDGGTRRRTLPHPGRRRQQHGRRPRQDALATAPRDRRSGSRHRRPRG